MKKNADSDARNQGNRKSGKQGNRKSGKQGNRKTGISPKGTPLAGNRKQPQRDAFPRESFPKGIPSGRIGMGKTKNFPKRDPFGAKLKTQNFNFLLTLVLALAFSFALPWWSVMLAAFLAGAIVRLKNVAAFFAPFLATSLFWIAYAWVLSSSNDFILAKKISVLFYLKGNAWLLLLLTGVIGGLSAGVAGVFGSQFRAVFSKQNS